MTLLSSSKGYTDASGSAAHNEALSAAASTAVADFLVSLGIERSRLRAKGMGESSPVGVDPLDPANRRVEIRIERSDARPF